jgi:hypothetical protein
MSNYSYFHSVSNFFNLEWIRCSVFQPLYMEEEEEQETQFISSSSRQTSFNVWFSILELI